jgi:hypothetical protein
MVMNSSELRIGNYVKAVIERDCDITELIGRVSQISEDGVWLTNLKNDKGIKFGIGDIFPILLTEDIFRHLDYWESFYGDFYCIGENGMCHIYHQDDGFVFKISPTYRVPFEFVHELQNLYRALTGKELEIRREWL